MNIWRIFNKHYRLVSSFPLLLYKSPQ